MATKSEIEARITPVEARKRNRLQTQIGDKQQEEANKRKTFVAALKQRQEFLESIPDPALRARYDSMLPRLTADSATADRVKDANFTNRIIADYNKKTQNQNPSPMAAPATNAAPTGKYSQTPEQEYAAEVQKLTIAGKAVPADYTLENVVAYRRRDEAMAKKESSDPYSKFLQELKDDPDLANLVRSQQSYKPGAGNVPPTGNSYDARMAGAFASSPPEYVHPQNKSAAGNAIRARNKHREEVIARGQPQDDRTQMVRNRIAKKREEEETETEKQKLYTAAFNEARQTGKPVSVLGGTVQIKKPDGTSQVSGQSPQGTTGGVGAKKLQDPLGDFRTATGTNFNKDSRMDAYNMQRLEDEKPTLNLREWQKAGSPLATKKPPATPVAPATDPTAKPSEKPSGLPSIDPKKDYGGAGTTTPGTTTPGAPAPGAPAAPGAPEPGFTKVPLDAALTGTYNGLVDNVPAAAVTATAARAAEALANRSSAASKQAAQTAAQTTRREFERKGAEKMARANAAAAERTAAANAARPGLGAPPASAAPAGGAAPAAPAGGAAPKAGASAFEKLTRLTAEETAKMKAGGFVKAAPKLALGGAAMGAGRMVAGAATTAAGNALVDAALPRDNTNWLNQAGRGVSLAASGAAGGYVAGGPVGAIVGAVANPTMDVMQTIGETRKSYADAEKTDAETEAMRTRPPSAARLKNRAESAQRLIDQAKPKPESSSPTGTNLTGAASSTGTAFDNALPNRPAAPMPSTSPVAAAGTAVPMGDDIDPVTGKKRKKEPVDTYAGLA